VLKPEIWGFEAQKWCNFWKSTKARDCGL